MNKEVQQKVMLIGFTLLLLLDTGYTFFQHFTKELDGDLTPIVLFADHYESLEGDPFGWQAITEGKKYGGVNRFFVHWWMSNYFKTVPHFLQNFVTPVESVFYASALMKTLVHIFLLAILSLIVSGAKQFFSRKTLIAAVIIAPLLQSGGHFYKYLGIVDQSITYCSFYALPLMLLLWFLKPYYDCLKGNKIKPGLLYKMILCGLVIILPFSGPLVPGVLLVAFALLLLWGMLQYSQSGKNDLLTAFPSSLKLLFGVVVLLSLYSIFLGRFNVEGLDKSVSLLERYLRLPTGLYFQLTQKLAFPFLFLMIGLIVFLNNKYKACKENVLPLLNWIVLFALVYLLLLPIGGFRDYRPNVIRKDTFMPVIILLIFFYAYASFLIIQNKEFKYRNLYLAVVVVFSLVFVYADEADANHHRCQMNALQTISNSNEKLIKLEVNCNVMSWEPILKPEHSKKQARLIKYWNITDQEVLFYQE